MASAGAKAARLVITKQESIKAMSDQPIKTRQGHMRSHGALFRPGSPVLESGIYEVIHDHAHRTAHEVVLISRDSFPTCDTCLERVRFRLIRTAPYIFQDADFEESE